MQAILSYKQAYFCCYQESFILILCQFSQDIHPKIVYEIEWWVSFNLSRSDLFLSKMSILLYLSGHRQPQMLNFPMDYNQRIPYFPL